jgi:hypothetical protein
MGSGCVGNEDDLRDVLRILARPPAITFGTS